MFIISVAAACYDSIYRNSNSVLQQSSGFIASHSNFLNGLYDNGIESTLDIQHRNPYTMTLNRITIRFLSFDLNDGHSSSCGDNLKIGGLLDSISQPYSPKYCGASAAGTSIPTPQIDVDRTFLNIGDTLRFTFASDYFRESGFITDPSSKGFLLKYDGEMSFSDVAKCYPNIVPARDTDLFAVYLLLNLLCT